MSVAAPIEQQYDGKMAEILRLPEYILSRPAQYQFGAPHGSRRFWEMCRKGRLKPLFNTGLPMLDHSREVVQGGMWEPQSLFYRDHSKVSVFVGGYGTGKTTIGVKKSIALALLNGKAEHWTISPTEFNSDTVIRPMYEEFMKGRGISFRWKEKDRRYTIRYKGRTGYIYCVSGHNPEKFKGQNMGSCWMDEPFIQKDATFKNVMGRIRHGSALLKQLMLTGTPEQLGYGYELCEGDLSERLRPFVIRSTTMANKCHSPDYVRDLIASFTEKEYKAYVLGQFVNLAKGVIFYGFDPDRNIKALGDPGEVELVVGMDFNVNPMSAVIGWYVPGHLHIFDEIRLEDSDTAMMCRELRSRYGDRISAIYPDPAGNQRQTNNGLMTDHDIIEDHGYRVITPGRWIPRRDTEISVNAAFAPAVGPIRLSLHPRCKRLATDLQVLTHEKFHQQKKLTHSPDALKYLAWHLFPPVYAPKSSQILYS